MVKFLNFFLFHNVTFDHITKDNIVREEKEFHILYSETPDAFKWTQLTWENNFSNEYGRFKMSENDEKEFSLPWMEIPKGGVKPLMGTNQWFRKFFAKIIFSLFLNQVYS